MTMYEYILLMTVTFTFGVTFGYITETIRHDIDKATLPIHRRRCKDH